MNPNEPRSIAHRPYQLWQQLQFKLPAIFLLSLIAFLAATFFIVQSGAQTLLEKREWQNVELSSRAIVEGLQQKVTVARSLATAMANVASVIDKNTERYQLIFEQLLAHSPSAQLIAGGGIWPEPYKLDPEKERNSFFWGKDAKQKLQFFDDYNDPNSSGYHHEAWYVPSRFQLPGEAMWSGSYIDPYSLEPMVTVTVPVFKQKDFFGVSTVDMNLSGLNQLVLSWAESFGGLAFVVDRNNKLITKLPEQLSALDEDEFPSLEEMSRTNPSFKTITDESTKLTTSILTKNRDGQTLAKLASDIDKQSYQITAPESEIIAAILMESRHVALGSSENTVSFKLDTAPFFNEAGFVSILEMPETHWKVITVMPYSRISLAVEKSLKTLLWPVIGVTMLIILLIYVFIYFSFIKRVSNITSQLQMQPQDQGDRKQIVTEDRGELGLIVDLFNSHTKELEEVAQAKELVTEALRREKQKAEQASKAKSEFLSSMSHELRTPLNAILGFAQLLKNNQELPKDEMKEYSGYILDSGEHLLKLINQVLQLSAIEAGKMEVSIEPVVVSDVIHECYILTQHAAERAQVSLIVQKEGDEVVNADYTKLKQVLLNLTSNAIKYNQAGGKVEIRWFAATDNLIRIAVTDTGVGIAEANINQLFQAFNRLDKDSSGIEGTGIGLTVSKELMTLMNGNIGFITHQGKGSTFWIELPLATLESY